MAEIEDVVVLNVKADDAVRTVQDLRDNIKAYKEFINQAEIGTDEYKDAVEGLTQTQLALKNAMNASTASLQEVIQDAKGAGTSYNALVSQMAQLKQAFRATSDEMERARLGKEIKDINDQLKAMDAMQGNFQRNVGNYTASISDAFKDLAKDMPSFFGTAKKGVDDVSKSLALMGKQPIMGLVLILAPLLTKIAEKLKENGTVLEAIKKIGEALSPVMDALGKAIEWMANQISKAADWFVDLLGNSSETFKGIIAGAAGVGNVILNALLTPIRAAIEAVKGFGSAIGKVFKGDFSGAWGDAKAAGQGIADAFRQGIDISANFENGKAVAEKFIDGLGSDANKTKAKETGASTAKEYVEGWRQELDEFLKEAKEAQDIAAEDAEYVKNGLDNQGGWWDVEDVRVAGEDLRDTVVDIAKEIADAVAAEQDKMKEKTKATAEEMQKAWSTSVSAVSSVLGSLADIYEANANGSENAEKKIKALRIASATISTLQGAVGAYMQSVATIPPPAGIITGVAQAATVTAAGLAQIAKMRSTSLSGTSSSSVTPIRSAAPAVTAPSLPAASPSALATLASDTETLNAIGSQRVYILSSDLEANDKARKVRVAETTF